MLMTTQDQLEGFQIVETFGVVYGNTVRSRSIGRNFTASIKTLVGGEISEYSELLDEARAEAMKRVIDKAQAIGANAIVATRFETSDVMDMVAEIFVYGTAVRVVEKE